MGSLSWLGLNGICSFITITHLRFNYTAPLSIFLAVVISSVPNAIRIFVFPALFRCLSSGGGGRWSRTNYANAVPHLLSRDCHCYSRCVTQPNDMFLINIRWATGGYTNWRVGQSSMGTSRREMASARSNGRSSSSSSTVWYMLVHSS